MRFIMALLVTALTNWNINPYQIEIQQTIDNDVVDCLLVQETTLPFKYIEQHFMIALALEQQTKLPLKVQIAVDIIESGIEKTNASNYNNNCWITCKCNYDKALRKEHKDLDVCFKQFDPTISKTYFFKKYKNIQENWEHKANIIIKYKWFKPGMPFEWYAERLEGSYAESTDYKEGLIRVYNSYLKDMQYEILHL